MMDDEMRKRLRDDSVSGLAALGVDMSAFESEEPPRMKDYAELEKRLRAYVADIGALGDDEEPAVFITQAADAISELTKRCADLERIRRWNIEEDGADLLICKGEHDKAHECRFQRYVRDDGLSRELGGDDLKQGVADPAAKPKGRR